jgi:hypothetical protein
MNSSLESTNERKRGNPSASIEADDRAKNIANNDIESSTDTHREDLMMCHHFQGTVQSKIWIKILNKYDM